MNRSNNLSNAKSKCKSKMTFWEEMEVVKMKKLLKYLGLLAAVALIMAPAGALAETLYFSLDDDEYGLYSLNTSTGAATHLGETGVMDPSPYNVGLAPGPVPGTVYGSTWADTHLINTDGSGYTKLGGVGMSGMAYDPDNDILYGIVLSYLYTIDTTTYEKGDNLASPGALVQGLAYGNGGLYGLAGGGSGDLYFYNTVLNEWSLIGNTGVAFDAVGLAYNAELDILYAKGSQDTYLYGINVSDASSWAIGDTGIGGGGGLAYALPGGGGSEVPIPGAVWLLGSGMIGLAGLRRKLKN